MELRHLETFDAAVRHGSFVRAAAALDYAQSTITLQIQQLEEELGVKLFEREGRRLRLTEAGRLLRDQAQSLLERVATLRESMTELAGGDAGDVRFGAIEPGASERIAPLVARFLANRPRVKLLFEVGGTVSVSERVAAGQLDAGLCSPPASRLGLHFEPLYAEPMALLIPTSHPLAHAKEVTLEALRHERLLLPDAGCAYREVIERRLTEQGSDVRVGVEISSMMTLARAVQAGLGPGIIPCAAASPPLEGTLFRTVTGLDLSLTIGLVTRGDDSAPSRALAAFLALVRREAASPQDPTSEPDLRGDSDPDEPAASRETTGPIQRVPKMVQAD
jgi:LysR family transcriptional regulator, regulator of the ytmI operon